MANYLKLNKSYIGNDILENPEFNMLGPNVINSNFSEIPDGTDVSTLSGWSLLGTPTATIEGGKLKVVGSGSSQAARYTATGLTVGKVYNLSFTAEGDLANNSVSVSGYSIVSAIGGKGEFYFKAISSSATLYFTANSTSYPATVEYSDISLKESGKVEFVDNPYFKGVTDDTDVTTLTGWSIASSSYPATSTDVVGGKLVIVSGGIYEGAGYDLTGIPDGVEVNLKIGSVTGDVGNGALYLNGTGIDIPTDSGSVDYTFIKEASNTKLLFRAGFNTAGTTTYGNISIQPTNVFAYGYVRVPSTNNSSGNNTLFSANNVTFTANGISPLYDVVKFDESNPTIDGSEYILTVNVLSVDEAPFVYWNGAAYIAEYLSVGENKINFTKLSGVSGFYFGIQAQNSSQVGSTIVIDSMEIQEVKNQPKLIGVDNVSTVSAPTNSTVVINNGLTDGADTVTITYAEADATSTVQMRNFFQDAIVESANANNTGKVIEIKSPVLINDIVAS